MRLNTVIRLPDGREGTICYHNLDGDGGVWGRILFDLEPHDIGYTDRLPAPDFMLRDKSIESSLKEFPGHQRSMECVGEKYTILGSLTEPEELEPEIA